MDTNRKKGHNRMVFHLKKHKKGKDGKSFDPKSTKNKDGNNDEKPVLFQLGSLASFVVNAEREISTSRSPSPSLSPTPSSSRNILEEVNEKENSSFDSTQQNKELSSLSLKLSELQGSSPRSQVSGVTHASMDPVLLFSPSPQMMDRDQIHSLPILENNLSTVSNESLFSLSIGDHAIARDELFSYRDFKGGDILKSGELLEFSPSVHAPADSSVDMEDKASEDTEAGSSPSDSEDKSSNSNISWRNIGESNNSDEAPSSTQSFSYPITKIKKKKKKKKKKEKKKKTQQQQQKKKNRCCSWLCFKKIGTCCKFPSCDNCFSCSCSCCKRIKCCSCCSSCGWFFCCKWRCWSCCSRA